MYTVEEALQKILTGLSPLSTERVLLTECLSRVLAVDVLADIAMPAFTNSAVDGYAVRACDVVGACEQNSVQLTCIGEIFAGVWPDVKIGELTCVRIMTGAPLPEGADAIVMVEDSAFTAPDQITIYEAATRGQHTRFAGEDVRMGDRVLVAGTLLRPAEIGLLAQMGQEHISVFRAPRVAVFSTGDEVVELEEGTLPPPGKIRNSNSYALAALVQQAGALVISRQHLPDDPTATQAALTQYALPAPVSNMATAEAEILTANTKLWEERGVGNLKQADIIITAGGVSVGERDFVKAAIESVGTLDLWRVAMKPGKPIAFGKIGQTLIFGLPGNPVSAQVTFELFVRPAIWKLLGRPASQLARRGVEAILLEAVSHVPGRREYIRAITEWEAGHFVTRPTGGQSSANGWTLSLANSLLIVPENSEGVPAGEKVAVLLLE